MGKQTHSRPPQRPLTLRVSLDDARGRIASRIEKGDAPKGLTVFYEHGEVHADFELANTGVSLNDVKIRPWTTDGHLSGACDDERRRC